MPLTHKATPKFTRALRRDRTTMRAWAKDKSPEVQFRVREIFCRNLKAIERDPLRPGLRMLAAMNFMGIVGAYGHYRQWAGEEN